MRTPKTNRGRATRLLCAVRNSLLALALLAWGCGSSHHVIGAGFEIDEVELQGVKRFSKGALLRHLYSGESSWLPMAPDQPFDEALVAADVKRIEELYSSYGYREAVVTSFDAEVDAEEMEVDLRVAVDEGRLTTVSGVRIVWPPQTECSAEERAEVEEAAYLRVVPAHIEERPPLVQEGEPLEVARVNEAIGAMRQVLLNASFPLARVSGGAEIDDAAATGEVLFEVHPGGRARIASVRLVGLQEVPEWQVRRELGFAVGEPWTPARVRQMEQAVKAMRVFRWVASEPPVEVSDGGVEVLIRVNEAKPQSIRVGGQVTLETTRWQQQVRVDYTHTSLFGELTRLDLALVGGYAELPNPWSAYQHGPVAMLEPKFTKKGLLEDHLLWTWTPGVDLDIQEGYQYVAPRTRLAANRWFFGMLNLGLAHDIRRVDFFNVNERLSAGESILGRDFKDPFVLSRLETEASVFFTDSIVQPANGVILDAAYAFSGSWLASDFDFHQVDAGVRAYWRPIPRLQLASKLGSGLIIPYGPEGSSPFSHRLYLGGSNDVRGWGARRLAPRLEECDDAGDCESIPIGGQTQVHATVEARLWLFWELWWVVFGDMGDVQAEALTWKPEEWNYTTGSGLRIDTPMGRIRLDFGYRVNDPGIYDERRWAIHFGFGEAF